MVGKAGEVGGRAIKSESDQHDDTDPVDFFEDTLDSTRLTVVRSTTSPDQSLTESNTKTHQESTYRSGATAPTPARHRPGRRNLHDEDSVDYVKAAHISTKAKDV